ncbi:homeobox-domain-containing protein [Cylindrobasidium torrendii FP15055 ss-10]|uniref:Homeobox-domain-containing protein n=1 Tax=Cylindrobasidium torrendii FP15055 ss-10 TaxID=1314674 RepID=A0A0D7BW18_9AGAR|nr:homeobox-domain-containing protein [Cylindrobasidium torrendii FP15055 ss-10]
MESYNNYYPSADPRYASTAYPAAYPQSDPRKLPPLPGLNVPPHGGRADDRYYSGSSTSSSTNARSPAGYPGAYGYDSYAGSQPEYTLPPPPPGSSGMPLHTTTALPPRRGSHMSTTPPPTSPTGPEDSPTIKKKRKRADAAQLKILNDVYARTAFPSTEERQQLAKTLDMSPRSVQIWFQNKRQQTRQTRTASNHPAYTAASSEAQAQAEEASYARAQDMQQRSRPRGQEPASHWPKGAY